VEPLTIYARRRGQALVGSLTFLVLAVVAAGHGARGLAYLLVALTVVVVAYLGRRPRLSADARGITVVNLLRTIRIRWNEVAGFGIGSTGTESCVAVRRSDGTAVNAWVLADDVRSGYTPEQLATIVGELRDRLAAAGGGAALAAAADSQPRSEPSSRRFARSVPAVSWLVLCLFLVVLGIVEVVNATVSRPAAYARLEHGGVGATALFAGCGVVDLRTHVCRLTLTYGGSTRTWRYSEDFPQFGHLAVGDPVPVLVDPAHPATVYTVHDVRSGDNAGFGVLAVFGLVLAALGIAGLAFFAWLWRRTSRTRGEQVAPVPSAGSWNPE
jgi:hypothetical protein